MQNNQTAPEPVAFIRVSDSNAFELNRFSLIVNDWATKKGWNEPTSTEESRALAAQLARIGWAIKVLCDAAERVRHGEPAGVLSGQCVDLLTANTGEMRLNEQQIEDIAQVTLMHTELAEATEGIVNQSVDDHVPQLTSVEAELADVLIRVFHFFGKRKLDLGKAVQIKHEFNITRPWRHNKLK